MLVSLRRRHDAPKSLPDEVFSPSPFDIKKRHTFRQGQIDLLFIDILAFPLPLPCPTWAHVLVPLHSGHSTIKANLLQLSYLSQKRARLRSDLGTPNRVSPQENLRLRL